MEKKRVIVLAVLAVLLVGGIVFFAVRPKCAGPEDVIAEPLAQEQGVAKRGGRTDVVTDVRGKSLRNDSPNFLLDSNAENRETLDKLLKLVATGQEDRIDEAMIEAAALLDSVDLCKFVAEVLKLNDKDRSWEAVNLLIGYGNAEIVPVLRAALDGTPDVDLDKSVIEAVCYLGNEEQLYHAQGQEITDRMDNVRAALSPKDIDDLNFIIDHCLQSDDESVRSMGLTSIASMPIDLQLDMYKRALHSNYPDLVVDTLTLMGTSANVDTLLLTMEMLDSEDEEIRELAQMNVLNFVDQEFESAAEAFQWWEAHSSEFEDDLSYSDMTIGEDEEVDEPYNRLHNK